jgi:hypothetical protein
MNQVAHLYKITNKLTSQYYIGKHNGWEQNGYWGSGTRLKYNQQKYGIENYTYEILCISTSEYIFNLESKYVTLELIELDELCLNLRAGGEGALLITEDTRRKIGQKSTERQIGKKHKDITKQRISQSLKGKRLTDSTKKQISEHFTKTVWINDGSQSLRVDGYEKDLYIQKGFKLGRAPFTDEAKSNMGKSVLGRKHSEETKLKIGLTRKINKKGKSNG